MKQAKRLFAPSRSRDGEQLSNVQDSILKLALLKEMMQRPALKLPAAHAVASELQAAEDYFGVIEVLEPLYEEFVGMTYMEATLAIAFYTVGRMQDVMQVSVSSLTTMLQSGTLFRHQYELYIARDALLSLQILNFTEHAQHLFTELQQYIPWKHLQQLPGYYSPDLDSRPFWDPKDFRVTSALEAAYPAIRAEFDEMMRQASPEVMFRLMSFGDKQLISKGSWTEFRLLHKRFEKNCDHMPTACNLLKGYPEVVGHPDLFPADITVLRLKAGSWLRPHVGESNRRLVLHLPLLVPQDCCSLRVAGEVRHWQEGKVIVFDDTFIHEAWNNGTQDRYVLFMGLWHPDFKPPYS